MGITAQRAINRMMDQGMGIEAEAGIELSGGGEE
jgi:hypothetical protein